jgi:hypothetical protein
MNNKNVNVNKRNWNDINYGKTKKFLVLLDKSMISKENERLKYQNLNKEGAMFKYSDGLIEFLFMVMIFFKLDFRKMQTFCFLFGSNLKIPTPDYTTINKRLHKLNLGQKYISKRKKLLYIAMDGTGMLKTNRGEWLRYIHKKGKIKSINGFVKLLISVDVDTQEICGFQVFDDSEGETKHMIDVLLQTIQNKNQPIDILFGDGSYSKYDIFEMLTEAGIKPIINIPKNADLQLDNMDKARTRRRKLEKKIPIRTLVAREQLKDKDKWKKKNKYGQRWTVEFVFSAFKRLFGQAVISKKKKYLKNELTAKVNLYNLMKNC